MTEKRFVNKGKYIFQYGEWWCSANGEHCADVIATAINELIEENEQLKQRLESKEKAHTRCDKLYWELYEEKEQLKKRLDEVLKELYCKDRRLEELGEDIECCDK